jgi:hypothetical protein
MAECVRGAGADKCLQPSDNKGMAVIRVRAGQGQARPGTGSGQISFMTGLISIEATAWLAMFGASI